MDEKTVETIEAILKRGNDAEVRKKGDRVIILEVKKTIKHSTQRIGAAESHWG